jgi:indolepyruvate ferredoxin oxidoreductase alpha subunit
MQKLMLLGDEAIAQGAIDAGMSGIYAYPGLLPQKSPNM